MRRPFSLRGFAIALGLAFLCAMPVAMWLVGALNLSAKPIKGPLPPTIITQIRGMSDLATTEVHLSDFIEGENDHYLGRWSLHGIVVLGVDLSQANYVKTDEQSHRVMLSLPNPHIVNCKVDHDRSEELYIRSKVWFPLSDKQLLRNEVWKHADRKVQRLGMDIGYTERARVQAERVLSKLFEGMGWKVDFEWR